MVQTDNSDGRGSVEGIVEVHAEDRAVDPAGRAVARREREEAPGRAAVHIGGRADEEHVVQEHAVAVNELGDDCRGSIEAFSAIARVVHPFRAVHERVSRVEIARAVGVLAPHEPVRTVRQVFLRRAREDWFRDRGHAAAAANVHGAALDDGR